MNVLKIHSLFEWMQMLWLYRQAFPKDERKPIKILIGLMRQGKADIWCVKVNGKFCGFATTINGQALVMIDFFAMKPSCRNKGYGGQALKELIGAYPDRRVFIEIESPYAEGPEQPLRQRRKAFYRRCGFNEIPVLADVFGVEMELMGYGLQMTYDEYRAFYHDNYSPYAASRLAEKKHPTAL